MSMPADRESLARTIIMDSVYVILVALVVYRTADEITNGEFSRELSLSIYHAKGRILAKLDQLRTFEREKGHVLWEAMQTVEEGKP